MTFFRANIVLIRARFSVYVDSMCPHEPGVIQHEAECSPDRQHKRTRLRCIINNKMGQYVHCAGDREHRGPITFGVRTRRRAFAALLSHKFERAKSVGKHK